MNPSVSAPLGILAGLLTAGLWTATALCFESASRRLGSFPVNVLRLFLAALLFVGLSLVRFGWPIPPGLSSSAWIYLSLSGLVGFVIGDLFLFQAFVLLGARLSMLIYSSVPFMTAILGWAFLHEMMGLRAVIGMIVTVAGIAMAITGKQPAHETTQDEQSTIRVLRKQGILLAFGASLAQAAGLLLGKHGAQGIDSFSGTEIRALAGLLGFLLVAVIFGQLGEIWFVLKRVLRPSSMRNFSPHHDRVALGLLTLGAIFGPFLGVSLGLLSTQLLPTGMASTLMSLVPVLLIPVSAVIFHERIRRIEVIGAVVAVLGVALLAF